MKRIKGGVVERKRFVIKLLLITFVSSCVLISGCTSAQVDEDLKSDPLSSWNNTPVKQKIIDFVANVSNPSSPSYIPEEERIATFDLDGTLLCEKPINLQMAIAVQRLHELAYKNTGLWETQPYKAAWDHDWNYLLNHENKRGIILKSFEGVSQKEYQEYAKNFLDTQNNTFFKVPYKRLFYVPMIELVKYLGSNDFSVYVVSSSQQGLIRTFSKEYLSIERDRVIGSQIKLDFQIRDGHAVFMRKGETVGYLDVHKGKPENIHTFIGRGPILAFGNSDGDIEMLEYAKAGDLPSLALILHHDDAEREFAYNEEAEKALKLAKEHGWVIVSMKNDFGVVFEWQR